MLVRVVIAACYGNGKQHDNCSCTGFSFKKKLFQLLVGKWEANSSSCLGEAKRDTNMVSSSGSEGVLHTCTHKQGNLIKSSLIQAG